MRAVAARAEAGYLAEEQAEAHRFPAKIGGLELFADVPMPFCRLP